MINLVTNLSVECPVSPLGSMLGYYREGNTRDTSLLEYYTVHKVCVTQLVITII